METIIHYAITAHKEGKYDEAERLYLEILKSEPKNIDANHNLGVLKVSRNQSAEAISLFKTAIEVDPKNTQNWFSYANALLNLKKFEEAESSYRKIIEIDPNYPNLFSTFGNILKELGKLEEAEKSYKKAIELKQDYTETHYNLGNVLVELRKFDEAEACFKKTIELKPDFAQAHNNLGLRMLDLHKLEEAEVYFKKATKLNPDYSEAYNNLGFIQKLLKKLEDSLTSYNHAYSLKPDLDFLLGTLLHLKMYFCIWDDLTKNLMELTRKINNREKVSPTFPLLSLIDDSNIHKKSAETFSRTQFPRSNIFPKISHYKNHQKIRIGYFSADFKNHAVSRLITELFETHNRKKFEIHAFSFGLNTKDEFNTRIKKGVDYFYNVQSMSDYVLVKYARSLEIDIAIDLSGFTGGNRQGIFAMLIAPIQVNYLGYPGTMASDYMDYLIADSTVVPKKMQKYYSEKIVYLPNSYQPNLSKLNISQVLLSRQEVNLPVKGFVFCCFNNKYKITPNTFASWMRILKETDGSVLWLLETNSIASKNLKKEAIKFEINEDRLIFAPHVSNDEHLKRIQLADLFIDTFPYNAHTTASDALRVGLPVLTRIGNSFASRVAASLLNNVTLPELITTSLKEYESLAIELATNPNKLKNIKDRLISNVITAPLYNTKLFTKNLESAFTIMHEKHQKGLECDYIYVE